VTAKCIEDEEVLEVRQPTPLASVVSGLLSCSGLTGQKRQCVELRLFLLRIVFTFEKTIYRRQSRARLDRKSPHHWVEANFEMLKVMYDPDDLMEAMGADKRAWSAWSPSFLGAKASVCSEGLRDRLRGRKIVLYRESDHNRVIACRGRHFD
jgi:hypothetical protein